ncbi:HlyD family efflux transporter periplasmic adaptor subunit [Enterococcus plantarum]|uniref:HlyD family efflux transporter periplasmic adaptor subunit n=1 Tax=Enterococcus plantarum TaxID=1077675 RepID=UPI0014288D56|nr:HlyD family efflux transporter periplasmic adaptor subunit [Enterococcus plantarum]
MKATVLTEIDQLINQLQQAIDQLDIQKEAITTPVEPTGEINSQIAIVEQTKEQQIAAAKEKQKELLAAKEKNEVTLKSVENELKNSKILAPIDGTIHLNQSYEKVKDIPKGTVIADIYTKSNEKKLIVESQISSDKMSHIKVGMPIRMRLDRKGISEQILTGKVTEIAETSTTTEAGTFFVVKGEVKISEKNTVRYGLTGSLLFVIGKKTYWNQLMDFMFNND